MVAGGGLFGERYIGMRIPAWHQLGITKPSGTKITASEAFVEARLNYKYHSLPIGVTLPDGTFFETSDEVMVLREPTADDNVWRNLGIVGKGYQYIQNEELAAGIDAISKKTGWQFETAGALGKGETVFICLNASTQSVHGDEVKSFLLAADGKSANRSLRISVVPHRAVCENTLISAEAASNLSFTIAHNGDVKKEFEVWLNLISALEQSQKRTFEDLRAMGDFRISVEEAQAVFAEAFPPPVPNAKVRLALDAPKRDGMTAKLLGQVNDATAAQMVSYEYNMEQSRKWQEGALELYQKFNAGAEKGGQMSQAALEKLRDTPYAALQAVTELCDWGGTNRDSVANSALFGARANQKAKAWKAAMDLVKYNRGPLT